MVLTCVMLSRWLWGYATAGWIANALGFTAGRVRSLLASLEAAGEVRKSGRGSYGATIWTRVGQ
jgi:FaeA-like protein